MNLIKEMKTLKPNDDEKIEEILYHLRDKRFTIENSEPESDGYVYDKWSEKLEELEVIIEGFEELKDCVEDKLKKKKIRELKESITVYQVYYGGFKRMK